MKTEKTQEISITTSNIQTEENTGQQRDTLINKENNTQRHKTQTTQAKQKLKKTNEA